MPHPQLNNAMLYTCIRLPSVVWLLVSSSESANMQVSIQDTDKITTTILWLPSHSN